MRRKTQVPSVASSGLREPPGGFPASDILDALCDGVMATNAGDGGEDEIIVYVNRAACDISGYEPAELLGRSPKLLQGPATDPAVMRRLRDDLDAGRPFNGQTVNYRKDGTPFVMEWSISTLHGPDGEPTHHVAIQRDATLPTRLLPEPERRVQTDALTGLPNRAHLDRVLDDGSWLSNRVHAAVVVDVDDFKAINDAHGHRVGDEVLRLVPSRLTRAVRSGDLVARWGGEEFCVLMLSPGDDAAALGQRIVAAVAATPFRTTAGDVRVTASVGSASVGGDRHTGLDLLTAADRAMYRAKRLGRNRAEHVR